MKWHNLVRIVILLVPLGIVLPLCFPINSTQEHYPRTGDTPDEFENNHSFDNAASLSVYNQVFQNLYIYSQDDWFYVNLFIKEQWEVGVEWQGTGDLDIYVYDDKENLLYSGISIESPETILFDVNKTSEYYIRVTRFSGPETKYTLTFTRPFWNWYNFWSIYGIFFIFCLCVGIPVGRVVIRKIYFAIIKRRNRKKPIFILVNHIRSEYQRTLTMDLKEVSKGKLHIPFRSTRSWGGRCTWCCARVGRREIHCPNCGLKVKTTG